MSQKKYDLKLLLSLLFLVISMIFLSFAAAPLYNIFCKATGFGGITKQSENTFSTVKGTRKIKIEFDANVDLALPWKFLPKQRKTEITIGYNVIAFYEAQNLSNDDIIGTSVYNVSPNKAGKYFVKVHCFCFEEQLLRAHEKMLMPVSFYIDPEFEKDPEMAEVETITLSYSFFKVKDYLPNRMQNSGKQ